MKAMLRVEELFLFFLSIVLFRQTGYAWWWFPLLLFVPDAAMAGYFINTRIGAVVYNFVHHRALAVLLFGAGLSGSFPLLQLAGVMLFAHSSLDRACNYGLKFPDRFSHTHLS